MDNSTFSIRIGDRILVKTTNNLSFTGKLLENHFLYQQKEMIILKTSNESEIILMIPKDEIIKIFTMEGNVEYNV